VAAEVACDHADSAGGPDVWIPLDSAPTVSRSGLLGLAISRIENKLDLRALIELAGLLAALIAGTLWFFSIGKELILQISSCKNVIMTVSKTNIIVWLVIIFIFSALIFLRFVDGRKRLKADRHKGYKILQRVMVAHVKSPQATDYYYRWVIRARTDGLKEFSMPFQWTGTRKKFIAHVRNPSYTYEFPTKSDWSNGEFLLKFNRVLRKRDEEIIEFYFETETEVGSEPSPVISTGIGSSKLPRFNTILKVVFDPAVRVAAVYRRRYFLGIDDNPIRTKVVALQSDRTHSWRIPVKLGRRFAIRWEYA
jgi:hypothetical protein